MGPASMEYYNLAPQQTKFNHPFYYKLFESTIKNTTANVLVDVVVNYSDDSYEVDQETLKARGVIDKAPCKDKGNKKDKIKIFRRVPSYWSAVAEVESGGKLAKGVDSKKRGRDDGAAFDAGKVLPSGTQFSYSIEGKMQDVGEKSETVPGKKLKLEAKQEFPKK
jgi:hypothetical protein